MKESLRADAKFASGIDVPFEGRPQTRYVWQGKGKGRSLIACAHVDVVGPGDWKDAFEPKVEGDRLYGRGATDDKAAIVSIFLAVKILQALGVRLLGDFEVHLTNEEEVGMAGALAFVREGYRADGVLVLEPTDHNIYIANRGCLQFRIHVEGKQAHLGNKRYGVNAIEKAAKIIDALVAYEDRLIAEGKGYPLFEKFEYPGQVNVGTIKGGDFFSIVPDLVTMDGGIGFLPMKTMAEVEKECLEVIDRIGDLWLEDHCRVEFNGLKNEPYQMPSSHPFTDALMETLHSLGRNPEIGAMMATCDARYYFNQGGMPSIVYGGANSHLAHAKKEYADITDVLETAVDYAAFMIDWCGIAE
jgi:acetylornithine deacetylase